MIKSENKLVITGFDIKKLFHRNGEDILVVISVLFYNDKINIA